MIRVTLMNKLIYQDDSGAYSILLTDYGVRIYNNVQGVTFTYPWHTVALVEET